MKIALIHNLKKGGQLRAVYEEVKILSKKHTIDVYTLSTSDNSYYPFKTYVHKEVVYRYEPPHHFPGSVFSIYFSLPYIYKEVAGEIAEGGYDIAYVQPDYLVQSPYILQYLTIPSLYHCAEVKREFYENVPRKTKVLNYFLTLPFRLPIKWIDKHNSKKSTKIMVNSHFSKSYVDRVYDTSALVNHLGVDTHIFKKLPLTKKNQVLSVGTLSLLKGHDFIIRSLSKILTCDRPVFIIIGQGGTEKEYLLSLAEQLDVEMQIVENVSDTELVRYYNESKLYVFASQNEPFGLTLLEASACGTPVVAVQEGGASEILEDMPNSVLVKRDENKFAFQIVTAMQNTQIASSAKQIVHVIDNWAWGSHVRRLETIMKTIRSNLKTNSTSSC